MSRSLRFLAGTALAVGIPSLLASCCTCQNPWEGLFLDDGRTNISVTGTVTLDSGGAALLPIINGDIDIDASATTLEMTSVTAFAVSTNTAPTKTPPVLPFYHSSAVGPTSHSLGISELASAPGYNSSVASKYVIWLRIEGVDTAYTPAAPRTLFAFRHATPVEWTTAGAFTVLE